MSSEKSRIYSQLALLQYVKSHKIRGIFTVREWFFANSPMWLSMGSQKRQSNPFLAEKLSFWKEIQMCSAEYLIASGLDYEAVAAALMALEPLDMVD